MIRNVTFAALLLGPLAASAQTLPQVESVIVTGKSSQALNAFVGSIAVPTRLIGKLARWGTPICPLVTGVNDDAVTFVTRRLREVATGAGAPVSSNPKCRPNIQIVFTTEPQALVDDIRKTKKHLLGYYDTYRQLGLMARFRRPVQAWYMTGTEDARGYVQTDTSNSGGVEIEVAGTGLKLQNTARSYAVLGSRLGDGLRANLRHVTIIAEPAQLLEHEMGPVADYISMLALSQMQRLDRCQSLPSITNLLVPECARVPEGLSDIDLGYLRGLYHMEAGRGRGVQVHQIITEMRHEVLKESD
jgi:hypothetical protein